MWWFSPDIREEMAQVNSLPIEERHFRLLISGEMGTGRHELVEYFLTIPPGRKLIIYRADLAQLNFSPSAFVVGILLQHRQTLSYFKKFLGQFSAEHRRYVENKIDLLPHALDKSLDWYKEILFEYLTFIGGNRVLIIILENIDHLDTLQINKWEAFLEQIQGCSLRVIYSRDPKGAFHHHLKVNQEIILSKLSIQAVEKAIQEYFQTTALNARLITNHCYLKTGGNPGKIRLLLASLYSDMVKHGGQELLDISQLQRIKLPENWENIFALSATSFAENEGKLFSLMAYLDEPINDIDLQKLLTELEIPSSLLFKWRESGLLCGRNLGKQTAYDLSEPFYRKWQRRISPLESFADVLKIFARLQLSGQLHKVYRISDLLNDIDEPQMAVASARLEAENCFQQGQYNQAADRLYFILRLFESSEIPVEKIDEILSRLGDFYMYLKSYENAFETFRKLQIYNSKSDHPDLKKNWLEVNLKMARALVEMDAFQEARYLIRETRVKEFCDMPTIGQCCELLADIESNLGHIRQARVKYEQALTFYRDARKNSNLAEIYTKLKYLMPDQSRPHRDLIEQILHDLPETHEFFEFKGILLQDKIQLLLSDKSHKVALQTCHELHRLLNVIYQPKMKVQLAFYYGEIYTHLGNWEIAREKLTEINQEAYVKHRPELNVQTLIQLGMLYKEQSQYGVAQKILQAGMEIAFRNGLHEYQHEIKLHLGHIHLLVHSFLRAYDFLKESMQWAEKAQKTDIYFLAKLYLAFYEIQHKKYDRARRQLTDAKKVLNYSMHHLDYLNYIFYLSLWLLARKRHDHAKQVIRVLVAKSRQLPRYQASGYYLMGIADFEIGMVVEATRHLKKALKISRSWNFPQVQYLSLCELARQSRITGTSRLHGRYRKQAQRYIVAMAENMGDEILSTQFLESKFHETILNPGDKQKNDQV